jgi:hypothetical protein
MDVQERYRLALEVNERNARDLVARGLSIRQNVRETGLGRAIARALMLPLLGLFLMFGVWLQRRLLNF